MASGLLLREARRRAGLTQAELGERAGKAASAIGRWERGEVDASLETLIELVRAAGFDLTVGVTVADDHDLALIRRCLARTPAQRLADLTTAVRAFDRMVAIRG
ncbi:MAG TPA: helix-turn-helix transcriptional regulator [Acidimicrobiia bacterium]|nr:helix-turn-helix transcriptional regulator [Acidimicrobiia bacterium]